MELQDVFARGSQMDGVGGSVFYIGNGWTVYCLFFLFIRSVNLLLMHCKKGCYQCHMQRISRSTIHSGLSGV